MRGAEDSTLLKFKSRSSSLGRVFLYNQLMEPILLSLGFIALLTTIVAIDEYIDWLPSYRRAAEEMAKEDEEILRSQGNDNTIEYLE